MFRRFLQLHIDAVEKASLHQSQQRIRFSPSKIRIELQTTHIVNIVKLIIEKKKFHFLWLVISSRTQNGMRKRMCAWMSVNIGRLSILMLFIARDSQKQQTECVNEIQPHGIEFNCLIANCAIYLVRSRWTIDRFHCSGYRINMGNFVEVTKCTANSMYEEQRASSHKISEWKIFLWHFSSLGLFFCFFVVSLCVSLIFIFVPVVIHSDGIWLVGGIRFDRGCFGISVHVFLQRCMFRVRRSLSLSLAHRVLPQLFCWYNGALTKVVWRWPNGNSELFYFNHSIISHTILCDGVLRIHL